MLEYILAALIGFCGGAIIGNRIVFSLGLAAILQRSYSTGDDIFLDCTEPSLLFGMPIGALVGAYMSIFLIRGGVRLKSIAIFLTLGILVSSSFGNYLDGRIRPPLVKVTEYNQLAQVQTAIQNHQDLNLKDIGDRTALLVASKKGYFDIVKVLIQARADLNAKDNRGQTALMEAINGTGFDRHPEIAKALIEAGADVNAKDVSGMTALMMAARIGDVATAKALIQAGSDIDAKADNGTTALMEARGEGQSKIVDILRQASKKKED